MVVVQGRGFKLLAWDASDRSKSLCVLAKSGRHSASICAQKLNPQTGLEFTSLQDNARTFTLVGGAAQRKVAKVVATFADGKTLTMRTRSGKRYKGRRRVRFWAGRHAGAAPLRTLAAKTARGATLRVTNVSPPAPPPGPPGPCGCGGGPPLARVMCPLAPCPE